MTDYYLDSVGGANSSPFATWANAATSWSSLVGSITLTAADRVIIGNNHVENYTASATLTTNGAMLISSTVSGSTTITYTPAVSGKQFNWTSGTGNLSVLAPTTGYSQVWGVAFQAGLDILPRNCIFNQCALDVSLGGTAGNLRVSGNAYWCRLIGSDVDCKKSTSGAAVIDISNRGFFYMDGGSVSSDRTTDNTGHEILSVLDGVAILDGVDFNGFTVDNFLDIDGGAGYVKATNCRLNSSTTDTYSGTTIAGTDSMVHGYNVVLDNTNAGASSTDVVLRWQEDPFGKVTTDTSIYLDSSDGTTSYSDKVVTSSIAAEFFEFFRYELASGFADFGTNKTLTVNFAQDGTATNLLDSEIWMEVQYPTSGNSSYTHINDKASDNQTTANQTTNSESWTGLGGTNTKQALSVTTSSGKEGPYKVFIYVAKASTTVYVDPKVNIT